MQKIIVSFLLLLLVKISPAQWSLNFSTIRQQNVVVLSAPNDSTCWFITNMDSLYKTSDAGQHWTKLPPSSPSFVPSGLFVMNNLVAFKSGNANLYKTIDGGINWSPVFSGAAFQPPAIWMKDENDGILTYAGTLYRTNNGGETWIINGITQPPFSPINSSGKGTVCGHGDSLWIALSSHGVAFSPDFGNSWQLAANTGLSFSSPPHISFGSADFGLAIRSNSSFVYVTKNGCSSWATADNSLGLNEDVLVNGPHCWYIPSPADHFYIKYSTDSGATWTQQLTDAAGFYVLEKSRSGNRLWAGTGNGHVYTYLDPIVPVQLSYVFTGNGNWSNPENWVNNLVPPFPLHAGINIIINPVAGGECIADVQLNIPPGVNITVEADGRLVVP